jgi:oligopeptide transport system substrate-binding protein
LPPALRRGESTTDAAPWEARLDGAQARQLLAAAGYAGGKNFPRLEVSTWARVPVLEAVQEMWRQELGIDVRISLRDAKVHADSLQTGSYDIGFITQIPDVADPAAALADFLSSAAGNYPHWSDDAFDRLLADVDQPRDSSERANRLWQADRRLIESGAIAPLYFNAKNWLMSPRVSGWREDALWVRDYREVQLGK